MYMYIFARKMHLFHAGSSVQIGLCGVGVHFLHVHVVFIFFRISSFFLSICFYVRMRILKSNEIMNKTKGY